MPRAYGAGTTDDNFRIAINGGLNGEIYYQNYWPLYKEDAPSNASGDHNTIQLGFRTDYNPKPMIYVDYGISEDSYPQPVNNSDRFKYEGIDDNNPDWSNLYELVTPKLSSSTPTTPAWLVKVNVLRPEEPDSLPSRTWPSEHYLDHVFGPINSEHPLLSVNNNSRWKIGLGKRFIKLPNAQNLEGVMVQTGVGISPDQVNFWGIYLDVNKGKNEDQEAYLSQTAIDPNDENQINSGSSGREELADAIASMLSIREFYMYAERMVKLQTQNLKIPFRSGLVVTEKSTLAEGLDKGLYALNLSKDEFQNRVIQAISDAQQNGNLEKAYHDLSFNVHTAIDQTDYDGIHYRALQLKMGGMAPNGNYTTIDPVNGNLFAYSQDRQTFSTEAGGAGITKREHDPSWGYFPVHDPSGDMNDLIDFVKEVEDKHPNDDLPTICTKIRTEYYGLGSNQSPKAFMLAVPQADYYKRESGGYAFYGNEIVPNRIKKTFQHQINIDNKAYDSILSHADENLVEDNPSPVVKDPNGNYLDLGHILFGFEALYFDDVTHFFYKRWGIDKAIDFAGYIADIGTALGEYIYHNNVGLPSDKIYYPETPDLPRYYEIKAPQQDILGDVDAFGLYEAHDFLKSKNLYPNSGPKLSALLEAYYKIKPVNDPDFAESYDNRWKLFCMHKKFHQQLVTGTPGSYNWEPGANPPTDWGNNGKEYQDFRDRIENFTTFWYNKNESEVATKFYGLAYLSFGYLSSISFSSFDSEINNVINNFLDYCKTNFENEQNTTL